MTASPRVDVLELARAIAQAGDPAVALEPAPERIVIAVIAAGTLSRFLLLGAEILIGRDAGCDIAIDADGMNPIQLKCHTRTGGVDVRNMSVTAFTSDGEPFPREGFLKFHQALEIHPMVTIFALPYEGD